ncbi:MAG: hypothetical protein H6R02_2256, partial [Burkholderiaceae bacterium]|nr:hypothetical protein [Burkholderiaceae bacterium]
RDADVLVTQTLPRLLADAPLKLRRDAKPLLGQANAQRAAARDRVLAALATARFARLALRLQAWTMSVSPKGRTLRRLAPRVLTRARKRLFDQAMEFVSLSQDERHRVRILAKRLRYALDALSAALPREAAERYIDALAELQDLLGELNDDAVARLVLRAFSGAPAIRVLTARLEVAERRAVEAAQPHLQHLRETPSPW